MAQQEIPLKCRAICSDCKKPFDLRSGGGYITVVEFAENVTVN